MKASSGDAPVAARPPILVRPSRDNDVEAMLYLPVDETPGRATPGYLERILEVVRSEGFPADYIAELESASAS